MGSRFSPLDWGAGRALVWLAAELLAFAVAKPLIERIASDGVQGGMTLILALTMYWMWVPDVEVYVEDRADGPNSQQASSMERYQQGDIENLQNKLRDLHRRIPDVESRGNRYLGGILRGEAASVESELRRLGA